MKKSKSKPVDQRKLPHVRAQMEVAAKHKLPPFELMKLGIMWDAQGDWQKVEAFFKSPQIQAQGGWPDVKQDMEKRRVFWEGLFNEALELCESYATPPTDSKH